MFGICATGFFFLTLWLRSLTKDLSDLKLDLKERVEYEWMEKVFKKDMQREFDSINKSVSKLTEAIIGTVEKKGMLTKVHEHDDRIARMEDTCKRQRNE